jgi:hypothetical protein
MNNVQNIQQAVTVLQMNLRGNSWGNWHGSQGRLPRSSPIRSDGSRGSQVERLDCLSSGQKTLKAKPNFKEDYQARVHSGQMVLMVVRDSEAGPHGRWPKTLK